MAGTIDFCNDPYAFYDVDENGNTIGVGGTKNVRFVDLFTPCHGWPLQAAAIAFVVHILLCITFTYVRKWYLRNVIQLDENDITSILSSRMGKLLPPPSSLLRPPTKRRKTVTEKDINISPFLREEDDDEDDDDDIDGAAGDGRFDDGTSRTSSSAYTNDLESSITAPGVFRAVSLGSVSSSTGSNNMTSGSTNFSVHDALALPSIEEQEILIEEFDFFQYENQDYYEMIDDPFHNEVIVLQSTDGENKLEIQPPPDDPSSGKRIFHLKYLVNKYGERKLRQGDSIIRNCLNLTLSIMQGIVVTVVFLLNNNNNNNNNDEKVTTTTTTTFVATGQFTMFSLFAFMILIMLLHRSDSWLAGHIFGGLTRARDGKYSRFNSLASSVSVNIGIIITYLMTSYLILPKLLRTVEAHGPEVHIMIFFLIYVPLIIGDTFGELIGGPYGGKYFPVFAVRGLGEINRKSVEGCLAVFVGSLVSCFVVCTAFGVIHLGWALICLLLATVTTIVETLSFRSTDNAFIPICNCAVLVVTLNIFGDIFQP